jgi:FtsP/CotA-like multicopper oxidase with cupredoxin domain
VPPSPQLTHSLTDSSIVAQWTNPTLQTVLNNPKTPTFPPSANIISLPKANQWSFWVIQAIPTIAPPIAHPIHLHGHDFYVLGAGSGTFVNNNNQTLNYINPPRRDVSMLPANGYLVLAFITDNPGAWLMHCHVSWHVGLGLGAQFLEAQENITETVGGKKTIDDVCDSWNSYYATAPYKQEDSGL